MQLKIARFQSDEFKKLMVGFLRGEVRSPPPRFILQSVYALASDGRERKLERTYQKLTSMTYTGKFCEGETLIGLRLEFGDATRELLTFEYELRTQYDGREPDTADVSFSIDF